MKKFIYTIIVSVLIISCSKDNIEETDSAVHKLSEPASIEELQNIEEKASENQLLNKYIDDLPSSGIIQNELISSIVFENEGRFLSFPSLDDYNGIVEDPSELTIQWVERKLFAIGHKSLYEKIRNTNKVEEVDQYFARLLSRDGTIEIGDFIFKIDFDNNLVEVICSNQIEFYDEFVNNNLDNNYILKFTFDQEVFQELEQYDCSLFNEPTDTIHGIFRGIRNIILGGGGGGGGDGLGCGEGGVRSFDLKSDEIRVVDATGVYHTVRSRVYYKKFGIYFTLKAESLKPGNYGDTWIQYKDVWYKKKCKKATGPQSHPWKRDKYTGNAQSQVAVCKIYSGTKALHGYHGNFRGRYEMKGIPSGNNPYTTYFTEYLNVCRNTIYNCD